MGISLNHPHAFPGDDVSIVNARRALMLKPLEAPAALLLLASFGMSSILILNGLAPYLLMGSTGPGDPSAEQMKQTWRELWPYLSLLIVINLFISFAAYQMPRGNYYALCLTASILAMIPILSPFYCAGVPFGLWAFLLLQRPEIRAAFQPIAVK